jgi:hypothetical protein
MMGDANPLTQATDHLRFGATFGAKSMIDRRRFNLGRARGGRQQKQGQAVRPARYRNAERRSRRDQGVEVA